MKRFGFLLIASMCVALSVVGGLFVLRAPARTFASSTCTGIQYGAFSKSISFIEAQNQGYFTQAGLNVCYNQVTGSQQQFDSLLAGNYDMISTATDNVANRYVNSNIPVQIESAFDLGMGLDLVVNTANGIHSIADLKGKTIAVDAPDSGFVLSLRKILAANGLYLEHNDYSLQVIGGVYQRYTDLVAGKTPAGDPVYATMLVSPFTEESHYVANLSDLAKFSSYVAPYQSTALAVTQSYAVANASKLTAFIKATIQGSNFAINPVNRTAVITDIASAYNISTPIATDVYNDMLNPISGENPGELINTPGLVNMIKLRQQYGGFTQSVNPIQLACPGKTQLYDNEYWLSAVKQLGQ